jgi:hypothetical protein
MDYILFGIATAGFLLTLGALLYGIGISCLELAKRDFIFTTVAEGEAKAVMVNERFSHFIMARSGYDFACNTEGDVSRTSHDPADDWNIIKNDDSESSKRKGILGRYTPSLLNGIYYIGIPPFRQIYRYRFEWFSLEHKDGKSTLVPGHTDDPTTRLDYILVQSDVYVAVLDAAECADNVPLHAKVVVYGRIENPYTALFGVEQWLESTFNLVLGRMRTYFAKTSFNELLKAGNDEDNKSTERDIGAYCKDVIAKVRSDFGFMIERIQLQDIEPAGDLAQEFIRASTQLYVAEQKAAATKAEASGEAHRVKSVYEVLANTPGAFEAYKAEQIAKSNLTVWVEGGGPKPLLTLPTTSAPAPKQKPSTDTEGT